MELSRDDRGSINRLNAFSSGVGQQSSMRNASGSTDSRQSVWRQQATPIQPPGGSRTGAGMNPYSGRMRTDINDQRPRSLFSFVSGASSTFDERPRKRVKQSGRMSTGGMRPPTPGRSFAMRPPANTPITIDDDEDIGVPVSRASVASRSSPDPLDSIPHARASPEYNPFANAEQPHPFDEDTPEAGPSTESAIRYAKRSRPSDGPHTLHLKAKLESQPDVTVVSDSDSEDSIQDADDFPSTPRKVPPVSAPPKVQQKINFWEKKVEPRHLDLSSVSIKKRMKPSQSSKLHHFPDATSADVRLAAPSLTSKSGKRSRNAPGIETSPLYIPLECWVWGTELLQGDEEEIQPYTLIVDEPSVKLSIRPGGPERKSVPILELFLDKDIKTLVYTHDAKGECPIIKLTTNPSQGLKKTSHFQAGSWALNGAIIFKFQTRSANWKHTDYQRLVTVFRRWNDASSAVDNNGAKAIWSLSESAVQMAKLQQKHGHERTEREALSAPFEVKEESEVQRPLPKPRPAYKGANRGDDVQQLQPTRRSARTAPQSRPASPSPEVDELILVYPPTGTGALNISSSDVKRLQPGEFLNDTLIEFGLKLWLNELRKVNPNLADQIYIFSSFFYKKLDEKDLEAGYNSVRKWTSKVDLFSKKYIIVPINENMHWYLAIIYEPEHILQPPQGTPKARRVSRRLQPTTDKAEADADRDPTPSASEADNVSNSASSKRDEDDIARELLVEFGVKDPVTASSTPVPEPTSHDEAPDAAQPTDGLHDVSAEGPEKARSPGFAPMEVDPPVRDSIAPTRFYGSKAKKKERATSSPINVDVDVEMSQPDEQETLSETSGKEDENPRTYIFTLDSLNCRHGHVIKVLKEYLRREAKDKKGLEETSESIGKQALVPLQPNYCDCGVYLLHFAKMFMEDPVKCWSVMFRQTKGRAQALSDRERDWKASAIGNFRQEMSAQIRELSEEWKKSRAVKEAERKEGGEEKGEGAADAAEESDDDIVVADIVPAAKGKRQAAAMHLR